MPRAIVDPEKLRQFASYLKRRNSEMRSRISFIKNSFNNLSDTWKDKRHEEFKKEFLETTSSLERFVKISEESAEHLRKKAEIIEKYLKF